MTISLARVLDVMRLQRDNNIIFPHKKIAAEEILAREGLTTHRACILSSGFFTSGEVKMYVEYN